MSIQTRESRLAIAQNYLTEHECPYAERLVRIESLAALGVRSVEAYRLSHFVDELQALHAPEGSCPTTHIDSSPTVVWADWVQDTVV